MAAGEVGSRAGPWAQVVTLPSTVGERWGPAPWMQFPSILAFGKFV